MKKEKLNKKIFRPDFIPVFPETLENENLEPIYIILLGVIYWLERIKGECKVSNDYLANLLNCKIGVIERGLLRLEDELYIKRFFKDKTKRHREVIKCLLTISLQKNTKSKGLELDPLKQGSKIGIDPLKQGESINNITLSNDKDNMHSLKEVEEFFISEAEKQRGFKPERRFASEKKRISDLLKRYSVSDLKEIIGFYLNHEKSKKNGLSLLIALSTDTLNLWLDNKGKFTSKNLPSMVY